jgi:hypothetical protein
VLKRRGASEGESSSRQYCRQGCLRAARLCSSLERGVDLFNPEIDLPRGKVACNAQVRTVDEARENITLLDRSFGLVVVAVGP